MHNIECITYTWRRRCTRVSEWRKKERKKEKTYLDINLLKTIFLIVLARTPEKFLIQKNNYFFLFVYWRLVIVFLSLVVSCYFLYLFACYLLKKNLKCITILSSVDNKFHSLPLSIFGSHFGLLIVVSWRKWFKRLDSVKNNMNRLRTFNANEWGVFLLNLVIKFPE